jgi:NADP-dependent 3-hydroxy acid dehydrogenase YdfG
MLNLDGNNPIKQYILEKSTVKTCLITGASSGIGLALAKALAADKHRLILTARREDRLKTLQSENVDIIPGDLTSAEFVDSLDEYVYQKYGHCDYLFNSAGVITKGSIAETDIDDMTSMLRLNIESTFRLTYRFLKRFVNQGSGHVINISSVAGTRVRPTIGAYAATKFAMEALSEAVRLELSDTDIKISCIAPGLVLTELHNDWEVHPVDLLDIREPLTGEDIVEAARFIMNQPDHVRIPRILIVPKGQKM